jgi:hypothetical protein
MSGQLAAIPNWSPGGLGAPRTRTSMSSLGDGVA